MDIEKFIACVKSYPFLYDRTHEDYQKIEKKLKTWEKIAIDMNESSEVLRVKWKGLRDSYTKHKKQTKSGYTKRSKSYYNWCWASHLQFLDSKPKRKSSSVSRISIDDSSLDSQSSAPSNSQPISFTSVPSISAVKYEVDLLESSESCQSENIPEPMTSTSTSTRKLTASQSFRSTEFSDTKRYQTNISADIDDNIQNIMNKHAESIDAVDLLFKSYAETFKKFSVRKQALLKVQLAKLFAESEIEEFQERESSTEFVSSPVHTKHRA